MTKSKFVFGDFSDEEEESVEQTKVRLLLDAHSDLEPL